MAMMRYRVIQGWATLLLLCAAAAPAHGQAAAEALFQQGLTELAAEHYDKACPAFAESQRLDPRPGTLFTLAECEAAAGKSASAVAHYAEYLHAFAEMKGALREKHMKRSQIAEKRKKELEPEVPRLRLVLPAGAPPGTRVERDGKELTEASLGLDLPVDPGEHLLWTQAPGQAPIIQKITIAQREMKLVELELRAPKETQVADKPALPPIPRAKPMPMVVAPDALASDSGNGIRRAGFVVGGLGIAGLVVGGIMGGLALGQKDIRDANCVEIDCNAAGLEASKRGKTLADASTAGFVVGGTGVAIGAVLLLSSGKKKTNRTSAGVRASVLGAGAGSLVGVEGAF